MGRVYECGRGSLEDSGWKGWCVNALYKIKKALR